MTENEYLRSIGKKLLEIKALADMYEEGCEYMSMSILDNRISVNNDPEAEGYYNFNFEAGQDIDNGEIYGEGHFFWIEGKEF